MRMRAFRRMSGKFASCFHMATVDNGTNTQMRAAYDCAVICGRLAPTSLSMQFESHGYGNHLGDDALAAPRRFEYPISYGLQCGLIEPCVAAAGF